MLKSKKSIKITGKFSDYLDEKVLQQEHPVQVINSFEEKAL